MRLASELLDTVSPKVRDELYRAFDDPSRTTWDRIPKTREGLKLDRLNKEEKILLHRLLQSCLSREGYLVATSIMFNEDIQQKFEPDLGKNEYWIEIFGQPRVGEYWSWQLEGHHLSLNFTFWGEKMVAHTPFLFGSNPQIVDSDLDRNGLNLVYLKKEITGRLVKSFSHEQRELGYSQEEQPNNAYGEIYRDSLWAPEGGIAISKLSPNQLDLFQALRDSYHRYFPASYIQSLSPSEPPPSTTFLFLGETGYAGKHYYRIKNEVEMIECENYGGHPHHLWRTQNDFGQSRIGTKKP